MSRRRDLNPFFRELPKPVLIAVLVVVGLPFHLLAGAVLGMLEGFGNFKAELSHLLSLDKD